MSSIPLFSIVTVTLNCAGAVLDTAKSVLGQEGVDFEYIVKDGGSRDKTVANLEQLGVKVQVRPDEGIYDAMNQALGLCSGQYVHFLNAGDTFYSSQVLRLLKGQMRGSPDLLYGNVLLAPMMRLRKTPRRLSKYHLFHSNINHQSMLAKRETYQRFGGFDTRYRYLADQHFLWRVFREPDCKLQHVDVILANFLYGGRSTHPSSRNEVRKERWDLLRRYYSPLEILCFGTASLYFLYPLKIRLWDLRYADLFGPG